jgi:hypothetical protein
MYMGVMYNTRNYCQILIKLEFHDRFSENIQTSNFMKISQVGAEKFHADGKTDEKTDRRTDMTTDTPY